MNKKKEKERKKKTTQARADYCKESRKTNDTNQKGVKKNTEPLQIKGAYGKPLECDTHH